MSERVEMKVKTTAIKVGDVMKLQCGPGWWLDIEITKITRDAEYVYLWFPMEIGPRRVLRANKRKITSTATVKRTPELPQLTDVVWARNAWDPNTLDVGPAAYVLEVFEYDCEDWVRVAACYDLDTIKALANGYDLLPALIARFGNAFTPGDHRVTYFGNPVEIN